MIAAGMAASANLTRSATISKKEMLTPSYVHLPHNLYRIHYMYRLSWVCLVIHRYSLTFAALRAAGLRAAQEVSLAWNQV
jgi:hypothetical protein